MAHDFLSDEQMDQAMSAATDIDPQSAVQVPGMKKVVGALIDDVPNKPGDDSIQPDYNSPIEAVAFAAPKAAMSATDAIANGVAHTDFGKLVGNEIGTLGKQVAVGPGSPAKPGALQRIAKAIGLPEGTKAEEMIELTAKGLKDRHSDLKQSDLVLLRQKANGPKKGYLSTTVDDNRGSSAFAEGGEVSSPDFIPDEQFNKMTENQSTVVNSAQNQTSAPDFIPDDQFKSDEETYSTPGQQVGAALEGAARGLVGPIAPLAEQAFSQAVFNQSPEETSKHIRAREEANPTLSKVSEGAALLGSMFTGTGEAALAAKAGEVLTKGLEGASLASKIGSGAAKAAIENMFIQGSDEASKMILRDPNSSVQTAVTNIGLAGLLGGTVGGTIEGTSAALKGLTGAHKIGQLVEDFKGRINEHIANPEPQFALNQELTDHYNNIRQVADDVYGPTGLKAVDIQKSMPEMSEKITNQTSEIAQKLEDSVAKMTKDSYKYPARLTGKLQEDLSNFKNVLSNAKSPSEIFNATQDLKQTLQGYAKFDKFVKPVDEAYDFVRDSKKLAFDLRNSLEDKAVWGKAAERQQAINRAFSEFKPALQDFEKKFTTEISGERVVDPGKIATYINQLGKPSAEIKQSMLSNFLDASEKYGKVINDTHANLGIESPLQPSSLAFANSTLKRKSTGAKLADIFINKGLTDAGGKGIGAAIGAGVGRALGVSAEIGALIGTHALGPFFSSVLPSLAKAMVGTAAKGEAFIKASNYAASVAKGELLADKAVSGLFKEGHDVLPSSAIPTEKDISKLDKILKGLQLNANSLINSGDQIGHYLPQHAASIGETASTATQYLNSLRPDNDPKAPLDNRIKPAPYQTAEFVNSLKIAQQPLLVLDKLKKGNLAMKDVMELKTLYPDLYKQLSGKITGEIVKQTQKGIHVPYKTRMGLSLFLGQPMDSTMSPASIIAAQSNAASQQSPQQGTPGKAPSAASTKELTKIPGSTRTPSQARQYNQQTKD
jgi:hypothetical protein